MTESWRRRNAVPGQTPPISSGIIIIVICQTLSNQILNEYLKRSSSNPARPHRTHRLHQQVKGWKVKVETMEVVKVIKSKSYKRKSESDKSKSDKSKSNKSRSGKSESGIYFYKVKVKK